MIRRLIGLVVGVSLAVAFPFSVMAAVDEGHWEYEIFAEPQFTDVGNSFDGGLIPVCVGNKWGYMDQTGEMVIHPQFNYAFPFHEGKAVVDMAENFLDSWELAIID